MRTISCTSAVSCGNTTASGGSLATHVVVLPCCSRTACEVTRRLPKRAASAPSAAASALGSRPSWLTGAMACGIDDYRLYCSERRDVSRSAQALRAPWEWRSPSPRAGESTSHGQGHPPQEPPDGPGAERCGPSAIVVEVDRAVGTASGRCWMLHGSLHAIWPVEAGTVTAWNPGK